MALITGVTMVTIHSTPPCEKSPAEFFNCQKKGLRRCASTRVLLVPGMLLRWTISGTRVVNKTYGKDKNLPGRRYLPTFTNNIWSYFTMVARNTTCYESWWMPGCCVPRTAAAVVLLPLPSLPRRGMLRGMPCQASSE